MQAPTVSRSISKHSSRGYATKRSGLRRGLRDKEDAFAVLSCWFDHQDAIPGDWKMDLKSIKSLSLTDLSQRPDLHRRSADITYGLEYLSTAFTELADAITLELRGIKLLHKKCGLAMLTNETLARILEYAATDAEDDNAGEINWKGAVTLSHVCKRFRDVMLSFPKFWSTMRQSVKMVEACLPRSHAMPLAVDFSVYYDIESLNWVFAPIFAKVLPHSKRWRRLHIRFDYVDGQESSSLLDQGYERRSDQTLRCLDTPLLEELEICGPSHSYGASDVIQQRWDWSQWSTPSLRRLAFSYLFPDPCPGLVNITSVNLTLATNDDLTYNKLKEIAKMPHLRDLAVQIINTSDDDGTGNCIAKHRHEKLEFPSVRQLAITTTLHTLDEFHNPVGKIALFALLFFPNAIDLRVKIEGDAPNPDDYDTDSDDSDSEVSDSSVDSEDWMGLSRRSHRDKVMHNMYFNQEITRIFRHKDQFPRVTTFELDVESPIGNSKKGFSELSIPFNMLPSLEYFTLRSNTRIDVVREPIYPGELFLFHRGEEVAPRVVGEEPAALKKVSLDIFISTVVARWLGAYLEKMRQRGSWRDFRRFALKTSECDNRGMTGEVALDWCRSPQFW